MNWNFHPLEVVDRVSETQLRVGENSSEWKLFRFGEIKADDFWNLADLSHVLTLTYLKADTCDALRKNVKNEYIRTGGH